MRFEATPARAPRSRLRRHGSGWAVAARGFFVWEESRREAEDWMRELASSPAAPGSRLESPGAVPSPREREVGFPS
jgi:hypothetical protein